MSCAFTDCGDPACKVCAIGRLPQPKPRLSASTAEPMREDAPALPKPVREKPIWMPKKRYRKGPHR